MIRVTFLKIGYIGATNLIEALLDERASRENLSVRVISSGCNMGKEEAVDTAKLAASVPSDLYVIVSPNASLPGPTAARQVIRETGKPIIIVSDEPSKKIAKTLGEQGVGYIVVQADPMIGARQCFLDPVEMALFNSDIIRVLAITGVSRLLHSEIDRVIRQLKKGEKPKLPQIIVDKEAALKESGLMNPYAYAKAMASFEIARNVASLSAEGCYRVEDRKLYPTIVAAAHEQMREAAILADEAREIEKSNDSVTRVIHLNSGALRRKNKLFAKFKK